MLYRALPRDPVHCSHSEESSVLPEQPCHPVRYFDMPGLVHLRFAACVWGEDNFGDYDFSRDDSVHALYRRKHTEVRVFMKIIKINNYRIILMFQ